MAPSSPKPPCASSSKSPRPSPPSSGSASSVVHHQANKRSAERTRSIRETFARAYRSQAYLCTNCGKRFYSPQALGGHQNAHHREKKLKQDNLLCARPMPRYPFPFNPPSFNRNDVCQLNLKPVLQYSNERNLSSQPSLNFKETGFAHPYLSNPLNDPNTVANYTIPHTIQIPSFPFGFDPKGHETVLVTFTAPSEFSSSFPSSAFDPKGNTALDAFTRTKEFSSLPDPNIASRNSAFLRNPSTAERNLAPRLKESVPIANRNPRLGMVAPPPSGGNNGGRVTHYLRGTSVARPAMAAGGVGDGEESNTMGLDLDLHL
ncbi:hypothetical protein COCNU_01G011740 [Cocos nucifera]|uniref:C2H2-type domain-containing protein n=1 Tax=Cocos nucifera TaxID=13894 RepID=A0A8K0HVD3_COCNU|nr:hypothetical protein COCNU_01G011740 [Cocos nucifera]